MYTRQMTTHVSDLLKYSLALVMEQEANVAPSKVFSTKAGVHITGSKCAQSSFRFSSTSSRCAGLIE
jgi:hypothetical protein